MEDEHAHIMKDINYVKSQQVLEEDEEEKEEALSLCDLPINNNSTSLDDDSLKKALQFQPSSLLDASELFNGFSSSSSSDMCPADDIIFRGRLMPFNEKDKSLDTEPDKKAPHRRRSESLSAVTRSNSENTCTSYDSSTCTGSRRFMMRSTKSLNYSRLQEPPAPEVHRNSSARSAAPPSEKKVTKPRWYSLMFGAMKVPPEMELNDMKNRQVRRNPSTSMFPAADHGVKVAENRSSGKVSWRILKALSCKDHSSVAVTTTTTSFALPQAS